MMDRALKKAINAIVKVAEPEKILLFGSRATNMYREDSDYDLLVLKKGVKKKRALVQSIYLSFENIGAPIDVIVEDTQRFDVLKDDPYQVYSAAHKEGKLIYEK